MDLYSEVSGVGPFGSAPFVFLGQNRIIRAMGKMEWKYEFYYAYRETAGSTVRIKIEINRQSPA
jgi:hypothetical protein